MSSTGEFDVLVVGGGPAGMAAAARAAQSGIRVGIVDDNLALGGQIWRGAEQDAHPLERSHWSEELKRAGVRLLCGLRVTDQPAPGILVVEGTEEHRELKYHKLILATGARERFLPFPGWTLPNVMGAGGLQAMVKSGLPIAGKRVVIAGTGPLLLAVASYLKKKRAIIPVICEQASWGSLSRFAMGLAAFPTKMWEGIRLKKELAGIPFAANSWPVAAQGEDGVKSVTLSRGGKHEEIACDFLACGFHLVPNSELPVLLGCGLDGPYVQVNDFQETTVGGVYCAGEPTGIGGVEAALIEGQIAGFAAAGKQESARKLFRARSKARRFAQLLDRTFALRAELKSLPHEDTFICRCEDVPYARLHDHGSWRAGKLHTRCGMGPCQGRVCGPAAEFLFGWRMDSVRPPIFPSRVENLAASAAGGQQSTPDYASPSGNG
jgi:NADPH-dependent 2,4-dienoyl-CoA reductase/sulfur reductase-like enzyme